MQASGHASRQAIRRENMQAGTVVRFDLPLPSYYDASTGISVWHKYFRQMGTLKNQPEDRNRNRYKKQIKRRSTQHPQNAYNQARGSLISAGTPATGFRE